MIRFFLNYLLPLILPILLYLGWVWFSKKRSKLTYEKKPIIKSGGLFVSLIIGILLMLVSLVIVILTGGSPPGEGKYQSPRFVNGKIIPPKLK